jgi:predicted transcriptional regulator YdeE
MKPTIVERDKIILVGFTFFGDPFQAGEWTEENEIGRLWKRFMAYLAEHSQRIKQAVPGAAYELHLEHAETATKGHFEIFVGMEVERLAEMPVELVAKILPAATYAVFTLSGPEINSDWPRQIYQVWLPGSGYQAPFGYNFQYYDHRFKGMDRLAESEIDVYVPLA